MGESVTPRVWGSLSNDLFSLLGTFVLSAETPFLSEQFLFDPSLLFAVESESRLVYVETESKSTEIKKVSKGCCKRISKVQTS